MNAKKLIMLGASAMLLASCGQSLTRKDAIEAMDTISKAEVKAPTKLTYVKEWKEENTGTKIKGKKTKTYDGEKKATHVVNDYTAEGKAHKEEAWIGVTGTTYTFVLKDGDTKQYVQVESTNVLVTVALEAVTKAAGSIETHLANSKSHASKDNKFGYCGFLARFDDEGKIAAGGSVHANVTVKDESYVKNGEGNIACAYNAFYEGQGDELMKAEWKNNLLVSKSNAKLTSSGYGFETWNWGNGSVDVKTDGYTKVEDNLVEFIEDFAKIL